jgi:AAHS family 4-hydroxybenzoate transporter-like MFS transporter
MTATPAADRIDVTRVIEEQKFGPLIVAIVGWSFAIMLTDGFDLTGISFAAPSLVHLWGVPKGAFGPLFSIGLFGIMVGSIGFGYIGDWIGRKRAMIAGAIVFGTFTLASVLATNLQELTWIRFIAGIGIGGAVPVAMALNTEFAPKAWRATIVIVMFTGYTTGAAIGGFVAAALIPAYGWQSIFYVGGIAPLIVAAALVFAVPESIRFLAVSGGNRAALARLVSALQPGIAIGPDTAFVITDEERKPAFALPMLFANGRRWVTPLLWLTYIVNSMALFFLQSWLPLVLQSGGVTQSQAAFATGMFALGGTVAALAIMRAVDRYGILFVAVLPLIGIPAVIGLGAVAGSAGAVIAMAFVVGCCTSGAQAGLNGSAGTFYPTAIRANGVGTAIGVAKIGSITSPLIGGMLISRDLPVQQLFLFASIPVGAALIGMLALGFAQRRLVNSPDAPIVVAQGALA